jgi:hypothetical protein
MEDTNDREHPFVGRLLRWPSGLRKGGNSAGHEVLATYWTTRGDRSFAFCSDGLLIDPEGMARFIPFAEIEDAGHDDVELLREVKRKRQEGEPLAESLRLTLCAGEVLELPLNERADGMSERLLIAGFVEQRVCIARSERRRRGEG